MCLLSLCSCSCACSSSQVKHLVLGFYDVVDEPLLAHFDFVELELLLCGCPEINVDDWMKHTECVITQDLTNSSLE